MYILSFDEHIAYLKRAFLRADFSKHLELDFYNRIMKCRPVQMHLIILRISWRRDVFRATEIMSSSI